MVILQTAQLVTSLPSVHCTRAVCLQAVLLSKSTSWEAHPKSILVNLVRGDDAGT